jgi:hypothetical protein
MRVHNSLSDLGPGTQKQCSHAMLCRGLQYTTVVKTCYRVRQTLAEGSQLFVEENGQAVLVEQFDTAPEYKDLEARVKEWVKSQPT